jgi:hypothetical protein
MSVANLLQSRFAHRTVAAGMNLQAIEESEARFEAYVQALTSVIGHKDRV